MKYLKRFETYSDSIQLNEELSIKGISSILASLMLTLGTMKAIHMPHHFGPHPVNPGGFGTTSQMMRLTNVKGGSGKATYEIQSELQKLKSDLEKLKKHVNDPSLESLITSIQSLESWTWSDGMDKILDVSNQLKSYIASQNVNYPEINTTLNNLTKADINLLQSDYDNLFAKYEEIKFNDKIGYIAISATLLLIILTILIAKYRYR